MALVVTAVLSTSKQYLGMTWSLWLACLSFLFAPFWFNPLSFHWGKVVQDYKIWMRWMTGTGGNASNSWEVGIFVTRWFTAAGTNFCELYCYHFGRPLCFVQTSIC